MTRREPEEFHRAVLTLRRAGYRIERATRTGVHFGRRVARTYISNDEVMQLASFYLLPPAQLELFPEIANG